jgi:hypothetical protein
MVNAKTAPGPATTSKVLYRDFDPATIAFGKPDRNSVGGQYVPLVGLDGSRQRVSMQTPPMYMPFEVDPNRADPKNPESDIQSYSIAVRLGSGDPREAVLLDKMQQLDRCMLKAAVAHSKAWFGKQKSEETLDDNLRKIVKPDKKGKHDPTMKIKIQLRDGVPTCKFFDECNLDESGKPRRVDIGYLTKGCKVRCILEADRVWFVQNGFGITWRADQISVVERPSSSEEYDMLVDDDDLLFAPAPAAAADAAADDLAMQLE